MEIFANDDDHQQVGRTADYAFGSNPPYALRALPQQPFRGNFAVLRFSRERRLDPCGLGLLDRLAHV
jgi:hypothetical protein